MASSKIKGITIEIGGNTSKLQDALKDVDKQVYGLNGDLKALNQALKLDPKNTELLAQKQDVLARNIAASKDRLETLKEAQRQMGSYNKLTDEQKESYNQLSLEIAKSESSLKSLNKELEQTKKAKFDGLREGLSKVGDVAKKTAKVVAGMAAAITTSAGVMAKSLFNNVKELSDLGDQIDKESQKLNISAENYQKLSYAMDMSGASIDDVSKGMKTIVSDLGKMSNGVSKTDDKYKKLGISLKNSNGTLKSSEQVLFDSIDALSKMSDETKRNAMAQEIFGKSAAELTPLLNSGSEGIKELMQEAEKYGMVMGKDAVENSALFNDSLTRLKKTMQGMKTKAFSPFLLGITQLMNGFSGLISGADAGEGLKMGIDSIVKAIQDTLPKILDTINQIIPMLLPIITEIILTIAQTIMNNLPTIIKAGIEVLLALIKGIVKMIPDLIPTMVECIITIVETLLDNIDLIIDAGIELIVGLVKGIIKALPKLVEKTPEIIAKLVNGLKEGIKDIFNVGVDLIKGLWEGIKSTGKWLWEKIKGFGEDILDWFGGIFGIASPSKKMRWQGQMIGEGLALGIEDMTGEVERAMNSLATGVDASVNPTINPTANTNPLYIAIDKFYNNRQTDIQQLAEELEFYRKNSALAKGGA